MITGLRVWDRDGREMLSLTGLYPKIVGYVDIPAKAGNGTIRYTVPEGSTGFHIWQQQDVYSGDLSVVANVTEISQGHLTWTVPSVSGRQYVNQRVYYGYL